MCSLLGQRAADSMNLLYSKMVFALGCMHVSRQFVKPRLSAGSLPPTGALRLLLQRGEGFFIGFPFIFATGGGPCGWGRGPHCR